jgi:DNA-directed RNA polymerase subunit RPC12/RpoP
METVTARLDIEVFVDCPHCGFMIDLMDRQDTGGFDHNEEGAVLRQACPDGHWSEEHKEFSIDDVECSRCKVEFNVKELEW